MRIHGSTATARLVAGFVASAFALLTSAPADASAQASTGFRFGFGRQALGGDAGKLFEPGIDAELGVVQPIGPVWIGAGANWASFNVRGADSSWSQVGLHGLVGVPFQLTPRVRTYVEARYTHRRFRPEDGRYFGGPYTLLRDFVSSGSGVQGVLGAEVALSKRVALDLRGAYDMFRLSPDLGTEGSLGSARGGSGWRWHAGVSWYPTRPLVSDAEARDSVNVWGQRRNLGLAVAAAAAGNVLPWTMNEVVGPRAELRISQISPRGWWKNGMHGWKWDDNHLPVNLFVHPVQGSWYYNAARTNGYGYWTGLAFAAAGSLQWECCGETQRMSINDWIHTALGGAAVGEVFYRTSSMILDNQATGVDRWFREFAATLLAPTRSMSRAMSGNTGRRMPNPTDARDWRPDDGSIELMMGLRGGGSGRRARGGSDTDPLPAHGFISADVRSGDLGALRRNTPFDWFTLGADVNFIRGRALGGLRIQGNLWHRPMSRSERQTSTLALVQDFDYENNFAFEQGGQGLSLMYYQTRKLTPQTQLEWRVAPTMMLLGAVKSELAFLANVDGIRERFREYDFGVGPGARGGVALSHKGRRFAEVAVRRQHIFTLNGSNFQGEGARHSVQTLRVRGIVPVTKARLSLGADYERFDRHSQFDVLDIGSVRQNANLWRVFMHWSPQW
jgi:hypothetical protein